MPAFLTPPRLVLCLGLWCAVAFGVIAEAVVNDRTLVRFDEAQAERLHAHAQTHPAFAGFFAFVTDFGAGRPLHLLVLGIGLVLILRGEWSLALLWMLGCWLNNELNVTLKGLFQRLRPVYVDPELRATWWGFPSGHSQNAMFAYGFLSYLGALAFPRGRWALAVGLMLLVQLIGLSRMVLGVHYFSDVLAGFLAAMALLAPCIAAVEWRRGRRPGG